jgi:hypothetical protein
MEYTFASRIWMFGGEGSWYFANLPKDISQEIKQITSDSKNAFGSVKVLVNINKTSWQTSLFPDSKSGCYVVPIKKSVRIAENLEVDRAVSITIKLIN